jgi:hypothetical protein
MRKKVRGGKGFEFARKMREKVRGEYRFSSLMKQKKGENLHRYLHRRIFFFKILL